MATDMTVSIYGGRRVFYSFGHGYLAAVRCRGRRFKYVLSSACPHSHRSGQSKSIQRHRSVDVWLCEPAFLRVPGAPCPFPTLYAYLVTVDWRDFDYSRSSHLLVLGHRAAVEAASADLQLLIDDVRASSAHSQPQSLSPQSSTYSNSNSVEIAIAEVSAPPARYSQRSPSPQQSQAQGGSSSSAAKVVPMEIDEPEMPTLQIPLTIESAPDLRLSLTINCS